MAGVRPVGSNLPRAGAARLRARIAAPGDPAEPVRPVDELVRGTPQRPAEKANPEELAERRSARDEGTASAAARRDGESKSGNAPSSTGERGERRDGHRQGSETPDEQDARELQDLKRRDAEVRRHESAHVAAGGGVVRGGARFHYQRGPDGRMYALGGEVAIDAAEGATPEETIRKARQIRRAALAPSEPSAQDRAVATRAATLEARARLEMTMARAEERAAQGDGAEEDDEADPKAALAARAYANSLYVPPRLKIKI